MQETIIKRSFRCEKCQFVKCVDHQVGKKRDLPKKCLKCSGEFKETPTSIQRMKERVTKVGIKSKSDNKQPIRCKGCGALFSGGSDMLGNSYMALHLSQTVSKKCLAYYEDLGYQLTKNKQDGFELANPFEKKR